MKESSPSPRSLPSTRQMSFGFRVGAIAGVLSVIALIPAALLFPTIKDALGGPLDAGIAELTAHQTAALWCQQLFAVSDLLSLVFIGAVAAAAQPPCRSLAIVGAFLIAVSSALDMFVAAAVVAATQTVVAVPGADPGMHTAGIALLKFAGVIDSREVFPWAAGLLILGIAVWRGGYWGRWLPAVVVANGVLVVVTLGIPSLPFALSFFGPALLGIVWTLGLCGVLWHQPGRMTVSANDA